MLSESSDSWKVSAALDMCQTSTEPWSLRQHSRHVVTILCSCELTEQYGFVIYGTCVDKRLCGWVRSKRWAEKPFFATAKLCWFLECARKDCDPFAWCEIIFCIRFVFSKTFSCTLEHHHGERLEWWEETERLLSHIDELPIYYCCHVLC